MARKLYSARIQGRQVSLGFRSALLSNRISVISRVGGSAAPLHFPPLLLGAPDVACLMCMPEGAALDFPEAWQALGFSVRQKAPFEGVSHRHSVAEHASHCRRQMSHVWEHNARQERRLRGASRGGGGAPLGVVGSPCS